MYILEIFRKTAHNSKKHKIIALISNVLVKV